MKWILWEFVFAAFAWWAITASVHSIVETNKVHQEVFPN